MNRHAENLGALSEHLAASQQRFAIWNHRHEPLLQVNQQEPTGRPAKQLRAAMGRQGVHARMLRANARSGNRGFRSKGPSATAGWTLWKVAVLPSTIRENNQSHSSGEHHEADSALCGTLECQPWFVVADDRDAALLKLLPASSNVVAVVHADQVLGSARGVKEDWAGRQQDRFLAGASMIPPNVTTLVQGCSSAWRRPR